jgi:hypothetical protein
LAPHADIERILKTERIVGAAGNHRALAADVEYGRLPALEELAGPGFLDLIDYEGLPRGDDAADNHPVEMAVGEIDLAFGKKPLDQEALAQAFRVAPGRVLWTNDLAHVYGNCHCICLLTFDGRIR